MSGSGSGSGSRSEIPLFPQFPKSRSGLIAGAAGATRVVTFAIVGAEATQATPLAVEMLAVELAVELLPQFPNFPGRKFS